MTKPQTKRIAKARTSPKPDPRDTIEISWHIDDVMEVRKGLSREQRRKVLEAVKYKHDATIGVSWDTLRIVADMLYPSRDGDD